MIGGRDYFSPPRRQYIDIYLQYISGIFPARWVIKNTFEPEKSNHPTATQGTITKSTTSPANRSNVMSRCKFSSRTLEKRSLLELDQRCFFFGKTLSARVKGKSWVPMGEYPRYIPTYTSYRMVLWGNMV